MSRSYYYLVAGLPDLFIDSGKKVAGVEDFIDEARSQVHPDDAALFDVFRYPVDNHNLIALLQKDHESFEPGGAYSRDELLEEIKVPDALPHYMQVFIDAHKEGRQLFADMSAENQLAWLFYDEVRSHPNEFIREWFTFDMNLRNILAALRCRAALAGEGERDQAFILQHAVVGRNDIAETILRSNAPDFSLTAQLPWVEHILTLSRDNLVEFEKGIDTLRWNMLNELTVFSYFEVETLLAFTVKLGIVQRWQKLDEQEGRKRFDQLVEELTSGIQLQEEP